MSVAMSSGTSIPRVRHSAEISSRRRSGCCSCERMSVQSQVSSASSSVRRNSRTFVISRICARWASMVRPSHTYRAKRAASTPTWVARYRTTSVAASCLERKKRPSYWKHLNKTANPRRVAPDLFPTAFNSSGRRVKCSSNSSEVHVRFIHLPFCLPLQVEYYRVHEASLWRPSAVRHHICIQSSVAKEYAWWQEK